MFNVADSAITVGVAIVLFESLRGDGADDSGLTPGR
jgi:lipoprotein signal peptidase